MIRKGIDKIDGMAAVLGKPMYVEDLAPEDSLCVKVLRSPYPHAKILEIDASKALDLFGVHGVFTYKDVPQKPITFAAEAAPEGSTHDRTILEQTMRFIGEPAAIVVADNERIAQEALSLIDVQYEILDFNIDYERAIDNGKPLYREKEMFSHFSNGNSASRNIAAQSFREYGSIDEELAESDLVLESVFHTTAQAHAMMETHRAFAYPDIRGKIVVYSSCQSVFNAQRIITEGLGLPPNKLRVVKPKVGGAFGGKNTTFLEGLVALASLKTQRACILVLSRQECFTATNTRHASRSKVRLGMEKDGTIRGIDYNFLINTGAHGEHSYDVLCVGCSNTLPIYGTPKAIRYDGKAAYTNMVPAGAYRGFGGPQTNFALEGLVSDASYKLGLDPTEVRLKNIIREGEEHPFVAGGVINSSTLEQLIIEGRKRIHWEEKWPCRRVSESKIRSVGMGIAMHGSGIARLDAVNANIQLNYDGNFTLFVGSCDLGTGADTVLLQMVSEILGVPEERINILVSDTDHTPYDKGAYASSTTFVTGNAVKIACEKLVESMRQTAAKIYKTKPKYIVITEDTIEKTNGEILDSFLEFAIKICTYSGATQLGAMGGYKCPVSPPPFVAGFVELEVDTETGKVELIDFVALADCGTVINPKLAKVQLEGGIVQCIGYTLFEDVIYDQNGRMLTDSFLSYRLPTTADVPLIKTDFIESYEPEGPFGAKSIGEVAFHTPAPAIREALLHATGISFNSLPITPEKIVLALKEKQDKGEKLPC